MKLSFKIGKNVYEITSLTLSQHYEVQQQIKINPRPQLDILSLLSGCPVEEIQKLDINQFAELWYAFQEYYISSVKTTEDPVKSITIDGQEYGLIDMSALSIGEFADLDVIVTGDNSDKRIHEVLSTLYRPIISKNEDKVTIEEYDGAVCKKRSTKFLEVDINFALRALNFFLGIGQESLSNTLSSLKEMMTEETNPWIKEIYDLILMQLQGIGSGPLPSYQERMYLNWREQSGLESIQPLTGWPTLKTNKKNRKESFKVYKNYELVKWQ